MSLINLIAEKISAGNVNAPVQYETMIIGSVKKGQIRSKIAYQSNRERPTTS